MIVAVVFTINVILLYGLQLMKKLYDIFEKRFSDNSRGLLNDND